MEALAWPLAAFAGVLLGAAELLSRYRDEPRRLPTIPAAWIYLGVNALIGLAGLAALRAFGAELPGEPGSAARLAAVVLAAGFGGAAFFRSAVARAKVGDAEIGVGPAFVIDIALAVTDRAVDRASAGDRTRRAPELMRDVPPDFAAKELTEYCIALMQNLSAAEERTLRTRVDGFFRAELASELRAMLIGLVLSENVGFEALEIAKHKLGPEIEAARARAAAAPEPDALEALIAAARGGAAEEAPPAPEAPAPDAARPLRPATGG